MRSEENPADIPTRMISMNDLFDCRLWWKGPEWLKNEEEKWQYHDLLHEDTKITVKGEYRVLHEEGMLSHEDKIVTPFNINEEKFSSYHRLIRVTAWCIRFVTNLSGKGLVKGHLKEYELNKSSKMWIQTTQQMNFSELMISLEKGKRHNLVNLGIYRDTDGLLKCKGRFPSVTRNHPILLPKKAHLTNLVIIATHRKLIHAGTSQTLSELRKNFWILQGRSAVRKMIRQCLICIHWEVGPFKNPAFAPMPEDVVSNFTKEPFVIVGVDYLGPLFTREEADVKKNWICLFTCLNIRAVHLELVETMTAEGFLLCVRRFIARRGKPKLIISDNGTNVKLCLLKISTKI